MLAPHYSALSIKGYRDQLEQALGGRAELRFVDSWHDEPGFVELLADKIRGTDAHVVFTAHSLPERVLAMGDPYKDAAARDQHASSRTPQASTTGASRSRARAPTGEPWLGPDILDHLRELHARGVERVLVCPVGFVSDHLEIRWDLDVEAKELAHELGLELERIEMPNDDAGVRAHARGDRPSRARSTVAQRESRARSPSSTRRGASASTRARAVR